MKHLALFVAGVFKRFNHVSRSGSKNSPQKIPYPESQRNDPPTQAPYLSHSATSAPEFHCFSFHVDSFFIPRTPEWRYFIYGNRLIHYRLERTIRMEVISMSMTMNYNAQSYSIQETRHLHLRNTAGLFYKTASRMEFIPA